MQLLTRFSVWKITGLLLGFLGGLLSCTIFAKTRPVEIYVLGCQHFPAALVKKQAKQTLKEKNNLHHTQQMLLNIDFIHDVTINKNSQKQLFIHIKEKTPIAKLLTGELIAKDHSIIKTSGVILPKLPYVSKRPEDHISGLNKLLKALQAHNIKSTLLTQVTPGLWDLKIGDKTIKLPQQNLDQALDLLISYTQTHTTEYAQITHIDLRTQGLLIANKTRYTANMLIKK